MLATRMRKVKNAFMWPIRFLTALCSFPIFGAGGCGIPFDHGLKSGNICFGMFLVTIFLNFLRSKWNCCLTSSQFQWVSLSSQQLVQSVKMEQIPQWEQPKMVRTFWFVHTSSITIYHQFSWELHVNSNYICIASWQPPCTADDSARSKWDESDFESLVLEDPSFSFLQAQEFFLSDVASCERTLEIKKPLKVPLNEKSKRAQLQQRYVVKHIKDALMSVAKMDASKFKDWQQTWIPGASKSKAKPNTLEQAYIPEVNEYQEVPAVELHMYPGRSLDVNSTWRVLLIPRIQELFGETVFLCSAASSKTSNPCMAKLTFNRLPLRLMHLLGRWKSWSPSLDPLRRAPHELLLSMELLLLAIILFMLWHVLDPLQKLLRMAWEFYKTPKDYLKKKNLLESSLPKTWMLSQHAYVYKAAGETELACTDALDACTEVKAPGACWSQKSSPSNLPRLGGSSNLVSGS